MEVQLDELFINVHGSQVLIATDDLWADVSVCQEEGKVHLDGLYIMTSKQDFHPLYKQGKTLDPKEHEMLFNAAEIYLQAECESLILEDFEQADYQKKDPNKEHRSEYLANV